GAAHAADAPLTKLDGGVDRTLRRLSQDRLVEGHLLVVGGDASKRPQDLESNQPIGLLEQVLLQNWRGLVSCKSADRAWDVSSDVLRHGAIAERDVEHAERIVAVLEKCHPRLVSHLLSTQHRQQSWQKRRTLHR